MDLRSYDNQDTSRNRGRSDWPYGYRVHAALRYFFENPELLFSMSPIPDINMTYASYRNPLPGCHSECYTPWQVLSKQDRDCEERLLERMLEAYRILKTVYAPYGGSAEESKNPISE
jgi:hypothetical protein